MYSHIHLDPVIYIYRYIYVDPAQFRDVLGFEAKLDDRFALPLPLGHAHVLQEIVMILTIILLLIM